MKVNYEHIKFLKRELKKINEPDFGDLEVYFNGKLVVFTEKMKEDAKFIGLNNHHLIQFFIEELGIEE